MPKPNLNLLEIPVNSYEMTLQASHSGVVILKKGRLRNRISGSSSYKLDALGRIESRHTEKKDRARGPKKKPDYGDIFGKLYQPAAEYSIPKSKIRSRIAAYVNADQKKRLYFVTVTFPQSIDDDLAYQALNTWLTVLRKYHKLTNYLWIAERQKNGTIHYHFLIPGYLNIAKANRAMQVILCNFIRKRKLNWEIKAAKRYNGVDMAKDRTTKKVINFSTKSGRRSLSNYVTKYITKNDGKFSRLPWHCSRSFSAVFTKVALTIDEARQMSLSYYVDRRRKKSRELFDFVPWNGPACFIIEEILRSVNFEIVNGRRVTIDELHKGIFPYIGRDWEGKKIPLSKIHTVENFMPYNLN